MTRPGGFLWARALDNVDNGGMLKQPPTPPSPPEAQEPEKNARPSPVASTAPVRPRSVKTVPVSGNRRGPLRAVAILVLLSLASLGCYFAATSIKGLFYGPDFTQDRPDCFSWGPGADLRKCDLSGRDLRNRDLTGADLSGSDLTSANLRDATLDSANLSGADLSWADLTGASLGGAILSGSTLKGVDMSHVNFRDIVLSGEESFRRAILRNVNIPEGVDLSGVSFVEADLSNSYIDKANLKDADFSRARIHETIFWFPVLKGAVFDGADMEDSWFADADLSKATMKYANLHNVLFTGSDVSRVDFNGSDLTGASFESSKVDKADFSGANLVDSYFGRATKAHKAKFDNTVCSDGVRSNDCYEEGRLLGIHP